MGGEKDKGDGGSDSDGSSSSSSSNSSKGSESKLSQEEKHDYGREEGRQASLLEAGEEGYVNTTREDSSRGLLSSVVAASLVERGDSNEDSDSSAVDSDEEEVISAECCHSVVCRAYLDSLGGGVVVRLCDSFVCWAQQ